jgi:hypothetical protein
VIVAKVFFNCFGGGVCLLGIFEVESWELFVGVDLESRSS